MQVNVNHSVVLVLKLGEEEISLNIPNPIYVYKLGDEVILNVMRPEKEEKFEIVKTVVTNVEHHVHDYSEGEQIIKITLGKIIDPIQGTTSN